jgi:DNA-binding response OmpR family regulator
MKHSSGTLRVLIVEDDRKMADLLQKGLREEGHNASVAYDGLNGFNLANGYGFDAIVLDVMMPGLSGFEVVRRLRSARIDTPVLMLTGRDADEDVVNGLNQGADDYLTKPFSFEVLLARLRALTRRGAAGNGTRLQVADLLLDTDAHEVRRGRSPVYLTRTEYKLLECLMQNAGRVVTRSTLIEAVWGYERDVENNTLDVFMRLLRSKVDNGPGKRLIQTVRGLGYSIREGDVP